MISIIYTTLPDVVTQKEIVNKLNLLSSKIELNTQINQTLEQIAQAIFKSWFIDFDPVHTKAASLARGETEHQANLAVMAVISGKSTAELDRLQTEEPERFEMLYKVAEAFPSGVDESGLPWGWEYQYLKDVSKIVYGKGLPKNQLSDSGYPVFGANGIIGFYEKYLYEKPQILVGCRGTVGQVSLSLPYSYITSNSLVIEYEKSDFSIYFLEISLKNTDLRELSSGSVQPQITIQSMNTLQILTPTDKVHKFYSDMVKPIYDKIYENNQQSNTLSKVRDELLPKLLNGENNELI
ncbi:restriction endonuclease subunit S [Necropsobacter rosorum]|uniref:restriction endonuclease subunit S n=1 Tax=Necropsobacter rosorum TaxID=908285 RepID=UPI003C7CC439